MKKLQPILLTLVFVLSLLAGGITLFLLPANSDSEAERRPLAEAPKLSGKAILNGRYFSELESWVTDHFQAREAFRRLKASWQLRVMHEQENNGLAEVDGSIVKLEKQVNTDSLAYAGERFRAVYTQYLFSSDCKVFCAVIPDKSFFLRERGWPVMEFAEMERLVQAALPAAEPISLTDCLRLEDYYRTDSHWRQERLLPAAARLLSAMGRETPALEINAFDQGSYEPFLGVYAGQSALDPEPETITWLSGGPLAECAAMDLEFHRPLPLYDPEGCDPRDPYTLFLGGAKGVIRLENPSVPAEGELVVFRDSFGSSIAPLLCLGYRTVTLVDIRYVEPELLPRFLRFTDQDVLFLYSATLLNNSQGLR